MSSTINHATASDFTKWEELAQKSTVPQLKYAIADCRQCMENFEGYQGDVVSNYYKDQLLTYAQELNRRRLKNKV